MLRTIAVILAAALLAGCRPARSEVAGPPMGRDAVGYAEVPEREAQTVLVVSFTIRNVVTAQEWPIPLQLIRLYDDNDNLIMVGGRFGSMTADGISPRTGKVMGFNASVGLAEPFSKPVDPNRPRSVTIRTAFTWTDEEGRKGSIEKVFDVLIGQPDKRVLSDDVTLDISFREPVRR